MYSTMQQIATMTNADIAEGIEACDRELGKMVADEMLYNRLVWELLQNAREMFMAEVHKRVELAGQTNRAMLGMIL